jgi:hypothetical protein
LRGTDETRSFVKECDTKSVQAKNRSQTVILAINRSFRESGGGRCQRKEGKKVTTWRESQVLYETRSQGGSWRGVERTLETPHVSAWQKPQAGEDQAVVDAKDRASSDSGSSGAKRIA